MGNTKECLDCGITFEYKRSDAMYCSPKCCKAASYKRVKEFGSITETGKDCVLCEQKFYPSSRESARRQVCYNCFEDGLTLTRGRILDLVRIKHGGKCVCCGYNKYLGALHFHHIDPNEKDFTISNDRVKLIEAIEESKKCILVCGNCHAEIHAGLININKTEER